MSHLHWVPRQNKLEIPRDKDEVNKREIHECDGRAHDADTIVVYYESIKRELKIKRIRVSVSMVALLFFFCRFFLPPANMEKKLL
jgi:hypothetical protein